MKYTLELATEDLISLSIIFGTYAEYNRQVHAQGLRDEEGFKKSQLAIDYWFSVIYNLARKDSNGN